MAHSCHELLKKDEDRHFFRLAQPHRPSGASHAPDAPAGLGDCTTPESFRRLIELTEDFPLDAVPGNNDYDVETMRRMAASSPAARLHPEHALITRYGMKLSLSHYPKYALREARSGNADAALYGHTHQAVSERCGGCLLANPGELQGRTGRIGFGVLDTDTRIINLHNLDFYAP